MENKGWQGVGRPARKVDEQTVVNIRRAARSGMGFVAIGKRFGISKASAYAISTGKSWRGVTEPVYLPQPLSWSVLASAAFARHVNRRK